MAARSSENPETREALEKEAAKVLKKFGFPMIEGVAHAATNLGKAMGCLTRRVAKVDELSGELMNIKTKRMQKDGANERGTKTLDKNPA